MMKRILFLLILTACSDLLLAQTDAFRPVAQSLMMGLGGGDVRNSYLTPLLYSSEGSGNMDLGLHYERIRVWRNLRWTNLQRIDAEWLMAEDRNHNSAQWAGRVRYRYAVQRQLLDKASRLSLSVGPMAGADLGFDYNLKMASANNPAAVRATVNAGASAEARYHYSIRKRTCFVSLSVQAPLLGAAVVPEYGASYYETFYLNNTDQRVHFTSLHNQQDLDVRLTTDIPFAVIPHMTRFGSSLRVGLDYHIETMDINHIVTRQSSLQFVVGWVWWSLPFNPYRK